jgi:hypothetical protein
MRHYQALFMLFGTQYSAIPPSLEVAPNHRKSFVSLAGSLRTLSAASIRNIIPAYNNIID